MRRAAAALGIAAILSCCASGPAAKGVLIGHAFGGFCHVVVVTVYSNRYPGEWQGALQRVELYGQESGEPIVASRTIESGSSYRFTLDPGRYVVGVSQDAYLVNLAAGQVTRLDFPRGGGCI